MQFKLMQYWKLWTDIFYRLFHNFHFWSQHRKYLIWCPLPYHFQICNFFLLWSLKGPSDNLHFIKGKYKGDNLEGDKGVIRWKQIEITTRAKALDYRKKGYSHWQYFSFFSTQSKCSGSKCFITQKTRTTNPGEGTRFLKQEKIWKSIWSFERRNLK